MNPEIIERLWRAQEEARLEVMVKAGIFVDASVESVEFDPVTEILHVHEIIQVPVSLNRIEIHLIV